LTGGPVGRTATICSAKSRAQFALPSQSIQMVCQQFLANVQDIKQLRQTDPQHRYPYHPKRYMTVQWPAQAVSRQGKRLIIPMDRGRKSFSFHLPEHIGSCILYSRSHRCRLRTR
jgi:hypothetical protein